MNITMEQINNLRSRANVSEEEARQALEKNNGNIIDAIIYLESGKSYVRDEEEEPRATKQCGSRKRKDYQQGSGDDFLTSLKKVFTAMNETRVIVYDEEKTIVNVSMTITVLMGLFAFPLTATLAIIALVTGYKFKLHKEEGLKKTVEEVFHPKKETAEYEYEVKVNEGPILRDESVRVKEDPEEDLSPNLTL